MRCLEDLGVVGITHAIALISEWVTSVSAPAIKGAPPLIWSSGADHGTSEGNGADYSALMPAC